jgi:diguanylate cyclase (GGDEF)-like protein
MTVALRITQPDMNRARMQTWGYGALGLALALWLAGDTLWVVSPGARGPFPGLADWFWLGGYPAACAGLALLLRARVRGSLGPTMWLDGAIASAAVAALVAAGAPGRGLGTVAYPLGDVLLLCLAAGATALLGRRAGRTFVLVAAGLALCAIADAARLLEGVEVRAPLAALVLACAAALPPGTRRRSAPVGGAHVGLPAAFTLAALGVLVWDRQVAALADPAVELALAVPFLLVLRLTVSLRENVRLLERSRDEALTDALTGLGNRRALMRALSDALEEAERGRPFKLALFDLDGFKAYNDVFGHVAGDVLIEHLGGRLDASVKGVGRAFRMGGDEFCVLVPADRASAALVRAGEALREEGEGFRIDASVGVVDLPGDVADAEAALQIADRRMYAQKEGRPHSPARQSGDVLLRVIGEREPELLAHTRAVAELSRALATAMGLDAETRDTVARAAELHDVGKVAVPDAILDKPGPLDEDEEAFMRRHTVIGESIIAEAPALREVAALVRASHERWDGTGYPDGLAGLEIPLGARIVSVCDAYSAMRQKRPYGAVLGEEEALDELRRGAGSQFDPALVAAFCVLRGSSGGSARFIRAARLAPQPAPEPPPPVELPVELPVAVPVTEAA